MTINREKAIDRARKLMAMAADSSSPNEAAIAARRARSIMDQHQLNAGDLAEQSEFGVNTASQARKRTPRWEQGLAISIAKLNDCIVGFSDDKRILFKGFVDDAQLCEFMFIYLVAHGLKLSQAHMKANRDGNPADFKNGYMSAIREKITAMIEERKKLVIVETGQALMVVKQELVANEFGQTNYRTATTRGARSAYSSEAGHDAGKRTNIVTGVQGKAQARLQ